MMRSNTLRCLASLMLVATPFAASAAVTQVAGEPSRAPAQAASTSAGSLATMRLFSTAKVRPSSRTMVRVLNALSANTTWVVAVLVSVVFAMMAS